jgi:hypothetical protein
MAPQMTEHFDPTAMRALFSSGATRSYEWRVAQLKSLLRLLDDDTKSLYDALKSDLGKGQSETYFTEIAIIKRFNVELNNSKIGVREMTFALCLPTVK